MDYLFLSKMIFRLKACFFLLLALPFFIFSQKQKPPLIVLSDDVLSEQATGQSNQTIGYLGMNQDAFLRSAAFSWGPARFSIKGYDYTQRVLFLNGIFTNDLETGMPTWSTWSGLNDVFRQTELSKGLDPFSVGIGNLGMSTKMTTNPFLQRGGNRISYMASNASYQGRLMATHTNFFKGNWKYVISASKRYGESGFIRGTFYDAYSSFFSLGKEFSNHLIYFTAMAAYTKRGRSSPYTEEVFQMKGNDYNPNWGMQNGKIRNAKYRKTFKPLMMFTHIFELPKFQIQSTLAYQFGNRYDTRLAYQKTIPPDPTYYQKMPSYALRYGYGKAKAYEIEKYFKKQGQMLWSDFYEKNKKNKESLYYLYGDEQTDKNWDFHTLLHYQMSEKWNFSIAFSNTYLIRNYFGKIHDLLGGDFIMNTDAFRNDNTKYYDLQNPKNKLRKGDTFQYDYSLDANRINVFLKQDYHSKHWDFYMAFSIEKITSQRKGFFQNGKYPNHSFGDAPMNQFMGFSLKTGGILKISNRHLFVFNGAFFKKTPLLKQIYINPREHSKTFENKKLPNEYAAELNYHYRGKFLEAMLTGFYTFFENAVQKQFTYYSGLWLYENDFSVQYMNNINKIHYGLEGFLTAKCSEAFKIIFTGAYGNYQYTNAPHFYLYNEKGENNLGKSFIKGYRVANSPEGALGLEFNYRSPEYWWVGLNINHIFNRYIGVAPLLHTASFWKDTDGLPFWDLKTKTYIRSEQVSKLLTQEKLSDIVLMNLVGGKSWKIKKHYLSMFFSINNVLNKIYKTGGFQQNRTANYKALLEDKNRTLPIFGNKYWYGKGTTYYLMLSWSF